MSVCIFRIVKFIGVSNRYGFTGAEDGDPLLEYFFIQCQLVRPLFKKEMDANR